MPEHTTPKVLITHTARCNKTRKSRNLEKETQNSFFWGLMSDDSDCNEFEDDLALVKKLLPPTSVGVDEKLNAEVIRSGQACGLDEVLLSRLNDVLVQAVSRKRLCSFAAKRWCEEAKGLEAVLEHLMKSRIELDERVAQLEEDELSLRDEVMQARELGENINEECQMIQDELERLTQVLFEEVNLMVSTEARAKHEELASAHQLQVEIVRVKEKLAHTSRRFNALKAKVNSSGKLVKQQSEPRIKSKDRSFSKRPLTNSGSAKALDEILQKSVKE